MFHFSWFLKNSFQCPYHLVLVEACFEPASGFLLQMLRKDPKFMHKRGWGAVRLGG
jgi:hypothetical protein